MRETKFRFWDKEKKKMLYELPEKAEEKVWHGDVEVVLTLKYALFYSQAGGLRLKKVVVGVDVFGCGYLSERALENIRWEYIGEIYNVDCVLMQYTGLKDKDGKEIYEGDLLYAPNLKVWVVCLEKLGWMLCTRNLVAENWYLVEWEKNVRRKIAGSFEELVQVIGNVFENPELVKKYELENVVKKYFK